MSAVDYCLMLPSKRSDKKVDLLSSGQGLDVLHHGPHVHVIRVRTGVDLLRVAKIRRPNVGPQMRRSDGVERPTPGVRANPWTGRPGPRSWLLRPRSTPARPCGPRLGLIPRFAGVGCGRTSASSSPLRTSKRLPTSGTSTGMALPTFVFEIAAGTVTTQ